MSCCDQCGKAFRRSYQLDGDGDGIEYLTETTQLLDGCRAALTVVFHAPGLRDYAERFTRA